MSEKKIDIKQSILWNTWGSGFYLAAQWAATVFTTRILGYEDAGIFSLAMSVTNIFYAFSVYGMRNYQISDFREKYSAGEYLVSRIWTGLVALLLCVLFCFANVYDFKQMVCINLYMVYKLTETIFDVFMGIYQKRWRMDYMGKSMTLRGLVMLICFPIIIYLSGSLEMAILVVALLSGILLWLYDVKRIKSLESISMKVTSASVFKLLRECLPLCVYLVLNTSMGSVPKYFLEFYRGSEQLGIYSSVATPTLIVQMAATYIFNPLITTFSEKYAEGNRKEFGNVFLKCVMAIGVISLAALVGAKLFGRMGLYILYGDTILKYEYLLMPLVICTILTAVFWFFSSVLTVVREFKGLIFGVCLATVGTAIACMVCIPLYGMQGATVGLIFGLIVGCIPLAICLKRKIDQI